MAIKGQCECGNIQLHWQTVDLSLVPRACGCEYCAEHGAHWVSKHGTRFTAMINRPEQHRTVTHGSRSARFHECTHCNQPVFISADLQGEVFGVLNASCLSNPAGFAKPVAADFSSQNAEQKQERWRRNWCSPVTIAYGVC